MARHSDDETPETPDTVEAPATAETPVTTPPAAVPAQSGNKGVIAAIAGGTAVAGLLFGLLIGWIAFDNGGNDGDGRGDKNHMSQHHQSSRKGRQQDGGQPGGRMMPGAGGGQMMPGRGGQGGQQGSAPSAPDTAPTTPGTQATPQALQQG